MPDGEVRIYSVTGNVKVNFVPGRIQPGTPLRTRKDLQSLLDILDQTSYLAASENTRKNLQLADIVPTPDLGDYTSEDFTASEPLAQAGYAAAAANESELRRLWERYSAGVIARIRRDVPVPQSLVVQAPTPAAANAIRERLERHHEGSLNVDTLEDDLTKVLGWGRYSSLNYDLRAQDPSRSPLANYRRASAGAGRDGIRRLRRF